MIEIRNLNFAYPGMHSKVFNDFSLLIDRGRIYGQLGKNGTGKSTLLYLVSGMLRPGKGSEFVSQRYHLKICFPQCYS